MMCWLLRWCLKIYSNAVTNVSKKGGGAKSEGEAFVVVILTSPLQA